MKRGAVLFHEKFRFKDGEYGRKLIVVLNEPTGDDPFLVVRTTSQSKNKPEREGCHPDKNVFVVNPGAESFPKKTWVQLHEVYEFSAKDFLDAGSRGDLVLVSNLSEQTTRSIVNCLKRTDDLSRYHRGLLDKSR